MQADLNDDLDLLPRVVHPEEEDHLVDPEEPKLGLGRLYPCDVFYYDRSGDAYRLVIILAKLPYVMIYM